MIRQALQLTGWLAATAIAMTALFDPFGGSGGGLIEAGPVATAGAGLLGAAMCIRARRRITASQRR